MVVKTKNNYALIEQHKGLWLMTINGEYAGYIQSDTVKGANRKARAMYKLAITYGLTT